MGYTEKELLEAALVSYDNLQPGQSIDGHDRWTVINVFDDEGEGGTGLYACVIDTGDGNCIISFRGTNSLSDLVLTDLALLDNEETEMQKAVSEYVKYIYDELKKKGLNYDHFTFTGHSLGGNLAEHAAITAPSEMKERCDAVSYDGPGMSQKYIDAHKDDISSVKGKLKRFQWSFVGALLNRVDGEQYESVYTDASDLPMYNAIIVPSLAPLETVYNFFNNIIAKHTNYDMIKNNCDENGSLRRGNKDSYAIDLEIATVFLDFIKRIGLVNPITSIVDLHKAFVKMIDMNNKGKRKQPKEASVWALTPAIFSIKTKQLHDCMEHIDQIRMNMGTYIKEVESIAKKEEVLKSLWMERDYRIMCNELSRLYSDLTMIQQSGDKCTDLYDKYENKIISK